MRFGVHRSVTKVSRALLWGIRHRGATNSSPECGGRGEPAWRRGRVSLRPLLQVMLLFLVRLPFVVIHIVPGSGWAAGRLRLLAGWCRRGALRLAARMTRGRREGSGCHEPLIWERTTPIRSYSVGLVAVGSWGSGTE